MVFTEIYSLEIKIITSCIARKLLICWRSGEDNGKKQGISQSIIAIIQLSHEGKYVVSLDKSVKVEDIKPNLRVAVRSDNYILHKILPTKVDPLVSLMKV